MLRWASSLCSVVPAYYLEARADLARGEGLGEEIHHVNADDVAVCQFNAWEWCNYHRCWRPQCKWSFNLARAVAIGATRLLNLVPLSPMLQPSPSSTTSMAAVILFQTPSYVRWSLAACQMRGAPDSTCLHRRQHPNRRRCGTKRHATH